MGFFGGIFGKKRSLLDEFEDNAVKLFRASVPTSLQKLSDKEILKVSKEVMNAFKAAGEHRVEIIPGSVLFNIAVKFLFLYETSGRKFYLEHLEYELSRYMEYGLREDYKRDI